LNTEIPKYWWIGTNINLLADITLMFQPIARTDGFILIPPGVSFPEATEERARELLKPGKIDPVVPLNLIGGKSWRIKGKI
jgi:hypothetical protein